MIRPAFACALLFAAAASAAEPRFETLRLTDAFYGEGATLADFDGDGDADVVSGPFLYLGPDFVTRREIYPPVSYDPHAYSLSFLQYAHDVNGDGRPDVVEIGFPGKESFWYANPGDRTPLVGATRGHWDKHVAFPVTDNESPAFTDLTGDGEPELVFHTEGKFGYATPDRNDPTKPWTFHPISPAKADRQRFTHGIGVGDVNGDGRPDLLENEGWWENPGDLAGDPEWKHHPAALAEKAAQMYAYDVNGDGRNDVVTALQAHGYGLAWNERNADGSFTRHVVMGDRSHDNPKGVCFSQLHAVELVDMDGDGLKDVVTGKRFWAHGPKGDAEPEATPVVYYFRLIRDGSTARFEPVLVAEAGGVGTQVTVGDANGDGRPDVVVGNKLGTWVHLRK